MNKYMIHGGKPLSGVVTISGAKNAAVAILPATLLVRGVCRIENVPDISDVRLLLEILDAMGAGVRRLSPNTLEIDCSRVRDSEPSAPRIISSVRGSVDSATPRSLCRAAATLARVLSTSISRALKPSARQLRCKTAASAQMHPRAA